jgi:hypothetical protein
MSGESSLRRPGIRARCGGRAPLKAPRRAPCSQHGAHRRHPAARARRQPHRVRRADHPHHQRQWWRRGRVTARSITSGCARSCLSSTPTREVELVHMGYVVRPRERRSGRGPALRPVPLACAPAPTGRRGDGTGSGTASACIDAAAFVPGSHEGPVGGEAVEAADVVTPPAQVAAVADLAGAEVLEVVGASVVVGEGDGDAGNLYGTGCSEIR